MAPAQASRLSLRPLHRCPGGVPAEESKLSVIPLRTRLWDAPQVSVSWVLLLTLLLQMPTIWPSLSSSASVSIFTPPHRARATPVLAAWPVQLSLAVAYTATPQPYLYLFQVHPGFKACRLQEGFLCHHFPRTPVQAPILLFSSPVFQFRPHHQLPFDMAISGGPASSFDHLHVRQGLGSQCPEPAHSRAS